MIKQDGQLLVVSTTTTTVAFDGCGISSISNREGKEYLDRELTRDKPGLTLVQMSGKEYPLAENTRFAASYRILSENIAEIIVEDWNCDASIRVVEDEQTGDILLEPSCYSLMTGLQAFRMNLYGLSQDLSLILPIQQGCRIAVDNELISQKRFEWPNSWEAGFAVLDAGNDGFSVQTWDDQFCGKAIKIGEPGDPCFLGFETCARGPLDEQRAIGGLIWRISCHHGDWTVPVSRYRDWYWKTYGIAEASKYRPDWLDGIKLAVSWCPTERYILDGLKKILDPAKVFIHLPNWRDSLYDQDYPAYTASDTGRAFLDHARSLGFHVAPHCNACQISPNHPLFAAAVNFTPKHLTEKRLMGWSWLPVEGWAAMQGPPQSYSNIASHKQYNVLVNVHTGWSGWRRALEWQIAHSKNTLSLDSIFVDVSQWIYDGDRSEVENMTYAQGSIRLLKDLCQLGKGFCVSGEGRNEINVQYIGVSQFHLFGFAHTLALDGKDLSWLEDVTLPVSDILYRGLNRGIGYSYGNEDRYRRVMIDATAKLKAIPTLIFRNADYLESDECKYILSMM